MGERPLDMFGVQGVRFTPDFLVDRDAPVAPVVGELDHSEVQLVYELAHFIHLLSPTFFTGHSLGGKRCK